jgi:hypothetical protein
MQRRIIIIIIIIENEIIKKGKEVKVIKHLQNF